MPINYEDVDLGLTINDMLDLDDAEITQDFRWEVDSKEFKSILGVIKSIVAKSPIAKAVRLEATNLGLVISATDTLSFLQYEAGILNSQQVLQGSYTVLFSSLEPLIPMLPKNKTVIYSKDNLLYVQLVGGSFPISTINQDIFGNWDAVTIGEKIGKIDTEDMRTVIRDMLPYITSSEQPQDRKITFDVEDDTTYAFASYKWSMVRTPVNAEGIKDVDVRYKDLQILKQLLSASSGEHVHLYSVNGMDAIAVQSLNYSYYFVKSVKNNAPLTRKLLHSLIESPDSHVFMVNYSHFFQVVKFANQNPDIVGEISIRVSNDFLFVEVTLNNGIHSTFKIMGQPVSAGIPPISIKLDKEVALTTLRAITMDEVKSSTELSVVFSNDLSYVGFAGVSESIISASKER